jgi:cell division protein FtsL
MPRILDPELKFDERSILAGIEKSQKTFESAKSAATTVPKKTSVMKLVVEYKFYIIIALVLIVAIFLLYRYFKGRKKVTDEVTDIASPVFNSIDTGAKQKLDSLSEFIDDSESESDFCEEYIKKEVRLSDIDEIIPDSVSEPESESESVKSEVSVKSESEVSVKSETASVKSETVSVKSETVSVKSNRSNKSSDFLMEDALDVFQRYQ